jgi:hypothetical protein
LKRPERSGKVAAGNRTVAGSLSQHWTGHGARQEEHR